MLLLLCTLKIHNEGHQPQSVKICSKVNRIAGSMMSAHAENTVPCLYELIKTYAGCRGSYCESANEPFFIFSDKTPVQPAHVQKCLKQALLRAHFNPSFYSFHSLRIGRTQDLLKCGLSVETIKKLGRWQSSFQIFKVNYLHFTGKPLGSDF